jgi:hypothetical protein
MYIRKKKNRIILPDSAIDNGHDRELDCNDTGSEAKNIHRWVNRIVIKLRFFFNDYMKKAIYTTVRELVDFIVWLIDIRNGLIC